MNDITPKEAIANLNHLYGMVAPDIQRSLDVAIKALERPTGVWISVEPTEEDIEKNLVPLERIECSNCHLPNRHIQYDEYHDEITVTYHNTHYCPNCGAKMKGGAE